MGEITVQNLIYLAYPFALVFVFLLLIGPFVIRLMHKLKFGQQVREDGPATHLKKQNVPTMGGIMILLGLILAAVVFRFRGIALVATVATVGYGIIGFLDDFIKIVKKRSLGLRAYQKIIGQTGIAVIVAWYAYCYVGTQLYIPIANTYVDLGLWYLPFAVFVILAVVNAVNLTDGLDGLASDITLLDAVTLGVIIAVFAMGETSKENRQLAMFSMAVAGACLGFLRFNVFPARIFMGDTGALALGGALAVIGLFSKMALLLPVIGVTFVASCVSVILQVGSFKLRHGKRIFRMAPLHHHFELLGYHETTVVAMYVIVTVCACTLALMSVFAFV